MKLEDFDELFVGDPVEIEKNLRTLLPQAQALEDKSIYLQILSQIALAEALQKNFEAAHTTLNHAEKLLTSLSHLAKVRILLERGRVYLQSGNTNAARPFFIQSFELSAEHKFDYHTINAAHMMHFVAHTVEEKVEWNERAIELAETSQLPRGQAWLGPLYNNVGQAYIETKQYEKALKAFRKALGLREQEGYTPNTRVAKWAVARALRFLNRTDEAFEILLALIKEYDSMTTLGNLDIPEVMLPSVRGLVYEELAEIDGENAQAFAELAYKDLSKDEWFQKMEPERFKRLSQRRFLGTT